MLKPSNVAWNVLLARTTACACASGLDSDPPRFPQPRGPSPAPPRASHQPNHSTQPIPPKRENLMLHDPHNAPLAQCLSAWRKRHPVPLIAAWVAALVSLTSPGASPLDEHVRSEPFSFLSHQRRWPGPKQSSVGLLLPRHCPLFVARGPVRHVFPFSLLNSARHRQDTLALSLCLCLCLSLCSVCVCVCVDVSL